eukprot:m.18827 g.18827  ORF g.18827 m.18827 type:complete len:202 (+) comp12223_c0_seq2:161-766(+)
MVLKQRNNAENHTGQKIARKRSISEGSQSSNSLSRLSGKQRSVSTCGVYKHVAFTKMPQVFVYPSSPDCVAKSKLIKVHRRYEGSGVNLLRIVKQMKREGQSASPPLPETPHHSPNIVITNGGSDIASSEDASDNDEPVDSDPESENETQELLGSDSERSSLIPSSSSSSSKQVLDMGIGIKWVATSTLISVCAVIYCYFL